MNKDKLLGKIKEMGDTQENLAAYLGISRGTINNKINERDGASFTLPEIILIAKKYSLTKDEINNIFFAVLVS